MEIQYSRDYDVFVVTNLGFKISIIDLRKICFNKTYTIYGMRFYAVDNHDYTEIYIELSRRCSALVAVRFKSTDVFKIFGRSDRIIETVIDD